MYQKRKTRQEVNTKHSEWIKSQRSARVWLADSMTAEAQFAFISPLHRLQHWISSKRKQVMCWQQKGKECIYCKNGLRQQHDFTYGIFIEKGNENVFYLSTNLSTHSHFQRLFSELLDNNVNPCDVVFSFERKKIATPTGGLANGYALEQMDQEVFVAEVFRPSLDSNFQNQVKNFKWTVPEEVVRKLADLEGKPFTLIDFFLAIKKTMPKLKDKTAKKYAVALIENGIVDLRKARIFRK